MFVMTPLRILAVVCAALAATPALAQEAAPAADAHAHTKDGSGDGAAMKTLPAPAAPDGGHGSPVQTGQSTGQSKEGAAAAAHSTNGDLGPVIPDGAAAGLRRRANLKMLIVNAPKGAAALPGRSLPGLPPRPVNPSVLLGPAAARNAIGAATPGAHVTAFGAHLPVSASSGSPNAGVMGGVGATNAHRAAPLPDAAARPQATGINGTTMGRVAAGSAPVGGPAKNRSAINGTLIRPKP
jgi:hypothetical protein